MTKFVAASVSITLFLFLSLVPSASKAASVAVAQVTVTDLGGDGCTMKKTSSLHTVPASRIAHSITIDWTHYITVEGIIGGVHSDSESTQNTNALTHYDTFTTPDGTNIIVYAEADFSMDYCGAGGMLKEWNSKSPRKDDKAC